ncbi:unnamed protein product [Schistosoma guineensis]|nr:unnamed protein product [Schistosoma guineensis]
MMYCTMLFYFILILVHFQVAMGNFTWSNVEKLNDAERGIVMFRENEKLIKTQMNKMAQNLFAKSEAIKKYVKCISKQHQAESFHSFTKVPHYSTLKDCFMRQKPISKREKFNNKNKVCKILGTFIKKDIEVLNRLISKKYDILWRWNKVLFNYDFASRNIEQTVDFLKKLYENW